mmetsp:Transcript_36583/g.103308  ORF Transcript_36583/g.103308 Transcript_36583/m.103308 type:complete len:261 (+) Transcript_36583:134-916(+)
MWTWMWRALPEALGLFTPGSRPARASFLLRESTLRAFSAASSSCRLQRSISEAICASLPRRIASQALSMWFSSRTSRVRRLSCSFSGSTSPWAFSSSSRMRAASWAALLLLSWRRRASSSSTPASSRRSSLACSRAACTSSCRTRTSTWAAAQSSFLWLRATRSSLHSAVTSASSFFNLSTSDSFLLAAQLSCSSSSSCLISCARRPSSCSRRSTAWLLLAANCAREPSMSSTVLNCEVSSRLSSWLVSLVGLPSRLLRW